MYKVLIVDDEPIVREGLKYIIDWKHYGFEIVDVAENGLIGIDKIKKIKPDLVITDIKMPGINGLEMVMEAKKISSLSKFIILSGYSDFEYAQHAVALGALNYLLKPIEEEELIRILKIVSEQLKQEKREESNKQKFAEHQLLSSVYSFIVNGEHIGSIQKLLPFHTFQLIKFSKKESRLDKNELTELWNVLDKEKRFVFDHGNSVLLLLGDPSENLLDTKMQEWFFSKTNVVKISSIMDKVDQLHDLYKEIVLLDEKSYFFPEKVFLSNEIISKEMKKKVSHLPDLSGQLKEAIRNNQKKAIEKSLNEIMNAFQASEKSVEEVKGNFSNIVLHCIEYLEETTNKPIKEIEKDKIISVIWKESSIIRTVNFLKAVFYDFGRFFYQSFEKQNIVDDIKQYTLKNYHLNLSLKELANEFNYSQSYLGKKFRTQTGQSYHEYLDSVRMNQAKRLLEQDRLYIYEISKRVGYANYDYFHKKFKKQFGISPKNYQKQLQNEGRQ